MDRGYSPPPDNTSPAANARARFKMTMQQLIASPITLMIALFAIFYFLTIRPQQQRAKQHKEMLNNLRRGDTVVTAGGILGRVAKVKDDAEVMVEIADNVQIRVLKNTLTEVRTKAQAQDARVDKE
jgi:preprotein translocase subunit YajC